MEKEYFIIQGTTPKHTFKLPFDTALIDKVQVTYSQNKNTLVVKENADCELVENRVIVSLSQEETLKFEPNMSVKVQIRVLTTGADAPASKIFNIHCYEILNKAVLQ